MTAKRLAIIAGHGSLDAAYPPLILATAAVAMDMKAISFRFRQLPIRRCRSLFPAFLYQTF